MTDWSWSLRASALSFRKRRRSISWYPISPPGGPA
jgi:hypothetical protein